MCGIPGGTDRVVFTRQQMGADCRNNPMASEYVVTPGGVHFESEDEALYYMVVGCDCGHPWDVQSFIVDCLRSFGSPEKIYAGARPPGIDGVEKLVLAHPRAAAEFISHILNDRDLLEHGGSVFGSWLTPRGQQFIEVAGDAA